MLYVPEANIKVSLWVDVSDAGRDEAASPPAAPVLMFLRHECVRKVYIIGANKQDYRNASLPTSYTVKTEELRITSKHFIRK